MLSKMKLAAEVRQLTTATVKTEHHREEEDEQEEEPEDEEASSASDSDSNNNHKSKDLNQTTTTLSQEEEPSTVEASCNERSRNKTQDELLDIVEVSKKRRISKDSADSLSSFIRWSFSNAPSTGDASLRSSKDILKNLQDQDRQKDPDAEMRSEELLEENEVDGKRNCWPNTQAKLRQLAKRKKQEEEEQEQEQEEEQDEDEEQEEDTESTAENLALLKSGLSGLIAEQTRAQKRVRNHLYQQHHQNLELHRSLNPHHATHLLSSSRKTRLLANSFVDRNQSLHHQQQQEQQQVIRSLESPEEASSAAAAAAASALSYHLQQMLQQPNPLSLDELCSQVGLDSADSSQLVLAAALHKSLFEHPSAGGGSKVADSKSSVSSTTSANSLASNHNNNHLPGLQQQHLLQQAASSLLGCDSATNQQRLHLQLETERQRLRQRMLQGALPDGGRLHQQAGLGGRQQQRHAQAAAALSALASASTTAIQHQFASSQGPQPASQQPPPLNLNSFIHPALNHHASSLPGGVHLGALAAAAAAGAANHQQIVDFKCDTCPSSFDDRHRLMQHQSIHLELKKDWFTETPVDEVMKIFNRRRGEFLCNICNLRFEATLDYDQHNHSVHGPRPYCCQFCGNGTRTFRCWRQYLNHLYDHRYIFSCTIGNCDFTVNRRDSLRFHIFRFHLNCQLPQNQHHHHQQLHHPLSLTASNRAGSGPGLLDGGAASAADLNKWNSALDCNPLPGEHDGADSADDTDDEMNVAD